MIDLHAHTSESDGTLSPTALVTLACSLGLEALAITDHDTLQGFDQARHLACESGLELICGIEISTTFHNRTVHLLGYFLSGEPGADFRQWIVTLQNNRHRRNERLMEALQAMGVNITIEQLRDRGGPLPGRPHIAALMVEGGYVSSMQQAFDKYLDETARCYVPRVEPSLPEAIDRIKAAGGFSSLAHPVRVSRVPAVISTYVREMQALGLSAIEAYHSDHTPAEMSTYVALAEVLSLAITGGSDFHGSTKRGIELGTGSNSNLNIPSSVLIKLRSADALTRVSHQLDSSKMKT